MRLKKAKKTLTKRDRLILEIDGFLEKIRTEKYALQKLTDEYNAKLAELQAKYYPAIETHKANLRRYEEELEKLVTKYAPELFIDGDMFETTLGRVIRHVKEAVKRARNVLENLKKLGWYEAIIVEEKVNWQVLEQWPEERLIACGTERIRKTKIVYELKEANGE